MKWKKESESSQLKAKAVSIATRTPERALGHVYASQSFACRCPRSEETVVHCRWHPQNEGGHSLWMPRNECGQLQIWSKWTKGFVVQGYWCFGCCDIYNFFVAYWKGLLVLCWGIWEWELIVPLGICVIIILTSSSEFYNLDEYSKIVILFYTSCLVWFFFFFSFLIVVAVKFA